MGPTHYLPTIYSRHGVLIRCLATVHTEVHLNGSFAVRAPTTGVQQYADVCGILTETDITPGRCETPKNRKPNRILKYTRRCTGYLCCGATLERDEPDVGDSPHQNVPSCSELPRISPYIAAGGLHHVYQVTARRCLTQTEHTWLPIRSYLRSEIPASSSQLVALDAACVLLHDNVHHSEAPHYFVVEV